MPAPIRRETTPPVQKLPAPPKPAATPGEGVTQPGNRALTSAAKPASQAPAGPAPSEGSNPVKKVGQAAATDTQNAPTTTTEGRDGALASLRGESTFDPAAKPVESAAKALKSGVKTASTPATATAPGEKTVSTAAPGEKTISTAAPEVRNLGPEAPTTPGAAPGSVSAPPSDPNQRAGWWNGLSPEQQSQQIAADPRRIGSLDGLPASARDQANREQLQRDTTRLQAEAEAAKTERLEQLARSSQANSPHVRDLANQPAQTFLSDEKLHEYQNAQAVQAQLDRVEGQTDPVTGQPLQAQLLVYDPAFVGGEGRAAIAVGNVDTADHVAVSVPGLDSNVRDYMDNLTGNALNLYNESRQAGGDVATVAWMGYDAPGFSNVAVDNAAENGAGLLAQDVDAIRASRGDNQPHLTVIGHSYGSTTASIAADREGLAADDLVLIGSPGAGHADNVSDYEGIDSEHVWAGSASRDPVTYFNDSNTLGTWDALGLDPSLNDFGANRFRAESVNRGDGGLGNFNNHSRYYDNNSESLFNMASIVTGNYHRVQRAEQRDKSFLSVDDPEADRTPREVGY